MLDVTAIAAAVKVVGLAIKAGIAGKALFESNKSAQEHIKALVDLFNVAKEFAVAGAASAQSLEDRARYHLLVSEAFGDAFREYWVDNEILAPSERPPLMRVQAWLGDPAALHAQEFDQRVRIAVERWAAAAPSDPLQFEEALSDTVMRTGAFRALWESFTQDRPQIEGGSVEPLLHDKGADTREFERHFLKAWWRRCATPSGQSVQALIQASAAVRRLLMRDLLLADIATWGERHVFGNRRRSAWQADTAQPFLPLDAMYVEPVAKLGARDDDQAEGQPIQRQLHALLNDNDVRVILVSAHFGHGKSLSARRLARDLATRYLDASTHEGRWLPVFIRCQSDLLRDDVELSIVVRRAWKRLAAEIGLDDPPLDDDVFEPPGKSASAPHEELVYLFDGLDEVFLGERELEALMQRLLGYASRRHKVVVFSRPDALPRDLSRWKDQGVRRLELQPFEPLQIDEWLERWGKVTGRAIARPDIETKGLLEVAKTPILLLMIGSTWQGLQLAEGQITKARLYEQFFRDTAGSKHRLDTEGHPVISSTCKKLRESITHLPPQSTPEEALLWFMGRIAWEARCIEWKKSLPWSDEVARGRHLRLRDVEHILENELKFTSSSSDLAEVLKGVVLALQADLEGGGGRILFGHQSFREFLVARHWADQLRQLITADEKREDHRVKQFEESLRRARLLDSDDRSFAFLREILFDEGQWPFGWTNQQRALLRAWAERCVSDETLSANKLRDDQRCLLRESALALGSLMGERGERCGPYDASHPAGHGLRVTPEALRSLVAWFWNASIEQQPFFAPGLDCARAQLGDAQLGGAEIAGANLQGANLQGANLQGAKLRLTKLRDANLQLAKLHRADLRGAELQGANLQGAELQCAILEGARLVDAQLNVAKLGLVNLHLANLQGANLQGADLQGANLGKANLQGACLEDAKLPRANLKDAKLQHSSLRRAKLEEAKLEGAKLEDAKLQHSSLRRANLQSADLQGADLQGADFQGADFQGADLRRANLRHASLQGAKFSSETIPPDPEFDLEARGMIRV